MTTQGLTRVAAYRALRAGMTAGDAGKPLAACPYNPDGDQAQRWLTRWWLRGWQSSQPEGRDTSPA